MNKLLMGAFALAAVVAVPGVSLAATYAYVNQAGEVMTMEATTPAQALTTAPNIADRSGVMLIDDAADTNVVGDDVSGV